MYFPMTISLLVVLFVVVTAFYKISVPWGQHDAMVTSIRRRQPCKWRSRENLIATMKALKAKMRLLYASRGMVGALTSPGLMWPDCKMTTLGKEFRGTESTTITGKTCQTWASQKPHQHNRSSSRFPHAGLVKNYCRNPDNESHGPWCYTMDSTKRWEYCDVPLCSAYCKMTTFGKEFRGPISTTITGKTCQTWASQTPHQHNRSSSRFPNAGLVKNYCRNPDNKSHGPWCYTMDSTKRWEYCPVSLCSGHCKITTLGKEYRGTISTTITGKTCQSWTSLTPHHHRLPSRFPNASLVKNYCRNPDNESHGPWCYTMDCTKIWEYCDVRTCSGYCKKTTLGKEFRGPISTTITGKTCQTWASQTPHQHNRSSSRFPNAGLVKNYCRNPDNTSHASQGPWCYTMDSTKRWEYCPVSLCSVEQDEKCEEIKTHLSTWQGEYCDQSAYCKKRPGYCKIRFTADENQLCVLLDKICLQTKRTNSGRRRGFRV